MVLKLDLAPIIIPKSHRKTAADISAEERNAAYVNAMT